MWLTHKNITKDFTVGLMGEEVQTGKTKLPATHRPIMWMCMYACVLRVCTWPAFGPFGYLPHELKAGLIKAAQSVCKCLEKREKEKEKKEQL